MPETAIRLERREGYALLILAAEAWRQVTRAGVAALADACAALHDDAGVQAVILTGAGGHFCGDWSDAPVERAAQAEGAVAGAFDTLAALPQPVIAAVNGPAEGAGFELALAADVRFAAEPATFTLIAGAALPLAGGLTRLGRAVGQARAGWIALSGTRLTATEALRDGLVSAVVPPQQLLSEAERLAVTVTQRGPIAVRFAKEAMQRGLDMTLPQALRFETDLTVILQATADRAEGVDAFVEKRVPRFTGR